MIEGAPLRRCRSVCWQRSMSVPFASAGQRRAFIALVFIKLPGHFAVVFHHVRFVAYGTLALPTIWLYV